MTKIFIAGITLLLCLNVTAQKNKKDKTLFYFFTADWKPTTDADKAAYLTKSFHIDDTTWQSWNYQFAGPLMSIETYKDQSETIPHGLFAWYDQNGRLDSMGYTYEGKKDRNWLYYTDSFTVYTSEKFNRGKLLERKDREMLDKEKKERDTMTLRPGEIEAKFKGGDKAWMNYMSGLAIPDRATKLGIRGTARVLFVVMPDGLVADVRMLCSLEYSFDAALIKLIEESPQWKPAVQDGKNVKAYRIQPMTVRTN